MSNPPITREEIRELTWAWWLLLVGVLGVVAGVIVLAKPSHSLTTLAVISGIFVLIESAFELHRDRFEPAHRLRDARAARWISFILNGVALSALGWTMHALRRAAPTLVPTTSRVDVQVNVSPE